MSLGAEDREKGPSSSPEEILLRGEKILIATGSSPVRPGLFPFGEGEIYDSDTILKLARIPKTLAVVGAGVIGTVYGAHLAAAGHAVSVLHHGARTDQVAAGGLRAREVLTAARVS